MRAKAHDPLNTFFPTDFEEMLELSRFLRNIVEPATLVGPDGQQVEMPANVYQALFKVVDAMSHNQAVAVVPLDQTLTTSEAADYLGISRPTLIKLLEEGKIPFEQPNRHRRVKLHDIIEYRDRKRGDRRAILDEMTDEAYEDGTYFTRPGENQR